MITLQLNNIRIIEEMINWQLIFSLFNIIWSKNQKSWPQNIYKRCLKSENVKTNSSQILHSGGKWSFRTLDVKLYRTRCKIGEPGDWGGGG